MRALFSLGLALLILAGFPATARAEQPWREIGAETLATVQVRTLQSVHTGRTYRIFISVPETPAPAGGYPILYLLDGHATFALATLVARERSERGPVLGIEDGILVGIVHVKTPADRNPRADDFTPPAADLNATGDTTGDPQGGAERFFRFLEDELKPSVAADFSVNPKRQALFGHSYGGLFTLYTLFTHPDAFQRYIAASPSIWWNQCHILRARDQFLAHARPVESGAAGGPRLLVTVGDQEQTPLPHHLQAGRGDLLRTRRMVDNAKDLATTLSRAEVSCEFLCFPAENHGTARVPALNQAVRWAFAP